METSLSSALQAVLPRIESPGLAAGLLRSDGKVEYGACGTARVDTSLVLDSGMAFPAGSIIKPLLGVVALQLAADGALNLDDPLRRWVPEFIGTGDVRSNAPSPATLRQVLNHSAGIKCFTELLYWLPYELQVRNAQRQWGDADALAIANHFAPYFAPGTDFHYSNCGYALLGIALERAASAAAGHAVDMEELLRTRVFVPCGVAAGAGGQTRYIRYDAPRPNTQARPDTVWPEQELRGYMKPEHGGHDVTEFETYGLFGPAGALHSTLADLLALSAALHASVGAHGSAPADVVDAARTGSGFPLLSSVQYAAMLESIPAGGPGKSYGLGFQIFERDWAGGRFIGHGGNVMGVSSGMWYFPERGLHLVFLANRALAWERPVFEALLAYADR